MPYLRKHPHGKPMSMKVAAATLRALLAPERVKCVAEPQPSVFLNSDPVAKYSESTWETVIANVMLDKLARK